MRFSFTNGDRPLDGYTIKRGVGTGGFGEVFYAVSDAGKEVAMKRVQRNVDIEVRGVRQCLNLKSPNLVALYDIRTDDQDDVWIVMEYVHGLSLKEAVDGHASGMPKEEIQRWFTAIATGVAHLHDNGIVHRDLKPANIFDDNGTVKVGDYGLSKFISCSRRDGQTESVGTIHYMAPEIGKGEYGKEIDIYALGVMLYEMATGDVPFNGESAQEILFKHLTAEPDLSQLDDALRSIVARSLHKDPAQRFKSASEMSREFQATYVLGESPAAVASYDQVVPATAISKEPVISSSVVVVPPVWRPSSPSTSQIHDPLAIAVANSWQRTRSWWYNSPMGTPAKVAIVAAVITLVLINAEWLVPGVLVLATCYALYLVVQAIVVPTHAVSTKHNSSSHAQVRATAQGSKRPSYAPARRVNIRQKAKIQNAAVRRFLAVRPISERVGGLLASALLSTGIATVLTLVMTSFVVDVPLDYATASWWSPVLWTAMVSTCGSWILLFLGKRWEAENDDDNPRRFVQFFAGLLLGMVAYGLSKWLMFDLISPLRFRYVASGLSVADFPVFWIPQTMYAADGAPLLAAFLIYFGSLFLIVRWWRQVDPVRLRAFRIGSVIVVGLLGWVMAELWRFPQPWGGMVAVNIAFALQISAQWISPSRREMIEGSEIVQATETRLGLAESNSDAGNKN